MFVALQRRQLPGKLDRTDQALHQSHALAGDIERCGESRARGFDEKIRPVFGIIHKLGGIVSAGACRYASGGRMG